MRRDSAMDSWGVEKTVKSLSCVVNVLESIRGSLQSGESKKILLEDNLYSAIYNLSKLLCYFTGVEWVPNDVDVIFRGGEHGLEKIMVRYGIIEETSGSRRGKFLLDHLEKIKALLDGPRSPNRTQLHSLIAANEIEDSFIKELREDLEHVTMGKIEWDSFVSSTRYRLNQYIENMDKSLDE